MGRGPKMFKLQTAALKRISSIYGGPAHGCQNYNQLVLSVTLHEEVWVFK